jgi:hypothetical protein
MRLLQKSRGLRLSGQNPLKSPFFLAVSFNHWKGFKNVGRSSPRKVNGSHTRVSGVSDEACGKHG